ncbi:MAG: UbiX family flavin prenyltransferase [Coriobacteriales bacterium]|jgi:4-hydroxy-3-polyprenylbenzoate decarboxylase
MGFNSKKRVVVGITGASGTPLAVRCLETLRQIEDVETILVSTNGARKTAETEWPNGFDSIESLADEVYPIDAIDAPISSGTFDTCGMIVIPCSMKSAAGIACGYSDNLLLRAADVTLKEGRKLVLVVRETPFNAVHLDNLAKLSHVPGVCILPAVLSYYNHPGSIEDMERHIVGKALQQLGIEAPDFSRWEGAGE